MPELSSHASRYEQCVRDYAQELYRFAYRLSGNHHTAEDLVQETFSEAWRSIGKQREPDKSRAWLFQILRHRYARWLDDLRRHPTGRMPEEPEQPIEPNGNPATTFADQDQMQAGLNQLSQDIRLTFVMAFVENLTCREVAAQLGIPLGTVLSRLDSARRTLRVALADADPTPRRIEKTVLKIAT